MKLFTNKNLIQKLVIAIICVTLLNFCCVPRVQAAYGGKLFEPMKAFLTAIGDISMSLIQWGVTGKWTDAVDNEGTAEYGDSFSEAEYKKFWVNSNKIRYSIIQISPELIFANKIELLSVDFIGQTETKKDANGNVISPYIITTKVKMNEDGSEMKSPREILRTIIASWYVTLRTIAIVGLLSVLIYVGIRIIISSTAQDKAKYKQRLIDWLVAFVLLFFMHYIMAATVTVVNKVDEMLGEGAGITDGIALDKSRGYIKYKGNIDTGTLINTSNVAITSFNPLRMDYVVRR